MGWLRRLRRRSRRIRGQVRVLSLAYRHPCTPRYAKAILALVVGYALSPIDLIPDFVPVAGLLDDMAIVPLGIWLATRMVPARVMAECRAQAEAEGPLVRHRFGLVALGILLLWLLVVVLLVWWVWSVVA